MERVRAHRSERLAVLVVGGLSVLTGGLGLWAYATSELAVGDNISLAGRAVFIAINAATSGLLWWHRRYPVRVFAAILGCYLASVFITGWTGNGALTLPLWFGVFALTAYAPLPRAALAVATGWVLSTAARVWAAVGAGYAVTPVAIGLLFIAEMGFFYIAAGALGLGFRFQHQRAREAADRAQLLHEQSRAVHAEAIATERNRLARDLHDLAAHELMDVLLSVRALRIGNDDPTLAEIEEKTARALDNMRTVVRTLRDAGHADQDRLPLAAAAVQLIDTLRAERDVEVASTVGIAAPVDDASASTVLSVLKEAVLNAARHAPGRPVTVALDSGHFGVRLTVTNPTSPGNARGPGGTGYGLVGAAERAKLLGGAFDAGRAANGDWIARLHLPPHGVTP